MSLQEWTNLLWEQIKATSPVEAIAVLLAVGEVLLARANKIALYPVGIISVILSAYVLITAQLYGEALLNGYYLIMSLYGWWYWWRKKERPPVPITRATRVEWRIVILIVILGWVFLFYLLKYKLHSTVPVMDGFVSATGWAGMWLLAKRKLENWVLLNISNAVAIPLLFYKGLAMFSLLTVFLFIVAIQGYFSWRKILNNENTVRN